MIKEKPMKLKEKYAMEDLIELMSILRSEQGCPWDREQTHESIKHNVVEEAYEVVDAITSEGPDRLADELGDLLMQVVFHSQMAREKGEFSFEDVLYHICTKLISRHTHLFGNDQGKAGSAAEVLHLWEENKKKEKNQRSQTQAMKEVSRAFPALVRAQKIQKKASQSGFDWEDPKDVIQKIEEEILEIQQAFEIADPKERKCKVEEEIGDLLFSVVNTARFAQVDSETALDQANRKFIRRFGKLENEYIAKGLAMKEASLEELDKVWNRIKAEESGGTR
jgi:tetrapyrrole methylase family protein / MazG family protein